MSKKEDTRAYPRLEIVAQVQLGRDGDVAVYTARNLSMGGVFVSVELAEVSYLVVGSVLDVTISGISQDGEEGDPDAPPDAVVRARGKVVRLDPETPGLALQFEPLSDEATQGVRALLDAAKP